MCTMRVILVRDMLGTRETGWGLWDGKQVLELTSKQVKDTIKAGNKVCGLTLDAKENLVLDKEGFFTTDIMEHRHCGGYKSMTNDDCLANLFYVVIGSHVENNKTVYDCVSTRFEQLKLSEEDVRAYLKIGFISGGCRVGKDGKIEVASLEFQKEVKKAEPEKKEQVKAEETVKQEVKKGTK